MYEYGVVRDSVYSRRALLGDIHLFLMCDMTPYLEIYLRIVGSPNSSEIIIILTVIVSTLGTVKKCGSFKICHEIPVAKDTDVTIGPGKKQVLYPCVVTVAYIMA